MRSFAMPLMASRACVIRQRCRSVPESQPMALRARLARADEKCIPQNRAVALNRSGCPVRQRRSGLETSFRPGRFMGKVNIETLSQSALFRPQSGHRLPWPIGG